MTGPTAQAPSAGQAPRAFEREGLVQRVTPFVAAGLVAVAAGIVNLGSADAGWLVTGTALSVLTVVLALAVPWSRLPRWTDALPPLLYLVAVAAIRHGAGGVGSGYAPLFLIPILWIALYGDRAQLLVAIAALVALVAAPIILVGEPAYPAQEWRRLLILVTTGATLGLIVQRLVGSVHAQMARAVARGQELAAQRDTTQAILAAASDAVVSFELDGTVVGTNAAADLLFGRADLVGKDIFQAVVPEHETDRLRGGFERLVADAVPGEREARFEADLLRPDGSTVPVEISVARTIGPNGMRIHAFVRDTTTRRAAERGAQDHLDDLGRLLTVARDLGRPGVDGRTAICLAARDLSGADFVLFFTPEPGGQRLVVAGSSGDPTVPTDVYLDAERSVVAGVIRSGSPMFSGDLTADPRVNPEVVRRLGAGAAYWQPIMSDELGIGVLVAYWRRPLAEIPDRAVVLLGLFAAQAATVIERSDLLARLEALARTDALTGAANRRALAESMAVALADAKRSGRQLSVAMLDLDHFKRYNDKHGHQAGDDLLRAAVEAWMKVMRPGDVLARYGGEEFLALLPACDPAGAIAVADRLRAVVPGHPTASAGTATWDGSESGEGLIARADAALYEAKRTGRDRTVASAARPAEVPPDSTG